MRIHIVILVGLSFTGCVTTLEHNNAQTKTDLTVSERAKVDELLAAYRHEIVRTVFLMIDAPDNARIVAEAAVYRCQPHLDKVTSYLLAQGFDKYFVEGFVGAIIEHEIKQTISFVVEKRAEKPDGWRKWR